MCLLIKYLETTTLNHTVTNPPPGSGLPSGRVQNADFAQMEVDRRGQCLSIRQPYASLLVCGIKKLVEITFYCKFPIFLEMKAANGIRIIVVGCGLRPPVVYRIVKILLALRTSTDHFTVIVCLSVINHDQLCF